MNKQEAVSQIMEIKAVLPKQLQTKLIEAVKVLATFKMIDVDDTLPYNHPHLIKTLCRCSYGPLCLVISQDCTTHISHMASDINGVWSWKSTDEELHGTITDWLPLKSLRGSQIMDELGNELQIE